MSQQKQSQRERPLDGDAPVKRLLPALYTSAEVPMKDWGTNLDITKPAGWAMVLKALQPADWIPQDAKQTPEILLDVIAWVCHPVEKPDPKTGEVKVITRLVFIGKDRRTAALYNEHSVRNLRAAIASYPGEWPACGMPTRVYTEESRQQGMNDYGTFEFRPDLLPAE